MREDILSYRFLSEPEFAPSTEHGADRPLAFRVRSADYENNRYDSDLWVAAPGAAAPGASSHAPGTQARNVAPGAPQDGPGTPSGGTAKPHAADAAAGASSPTRLTACGRVGVFGWEDGAHLLFSSDRDPDDQKKREEDEEFTQFYRMSIHGGEAVPAFRTDFSVGEFRVLPGGALLLAGTAHYASEEERKARKDAGVTIINEVPMWSNGGGFVSDTRTALFLRDAQGSTTRLTPEELTVDDFEVSDDGETVLLSGLEYRGMRPPHNDLYRLKISSSDLTRLTDTEGHSHDRPVFTTPGKAVVAVTFMEQYGLNENPDFVEVDVQTGALRRVTRGLDRSIGNSVGSDCRHGKASPMRFADRWVYFVTTEGTSSGLRRLDPATGTVEDVYAPAGSVDGFAIHSDTVAVIELRADTLQELYRVPLPEAAPAGGVTARQLTSLNESGLSGRTIARPEYVTTTREDGTVIEGYVLAPPEADTGETRPGILTIHGGPKTVYGSVFVHELQVLAAQGYYVFFCNPRGSDGRGNEFADIRGAYGTVDYDDLMAFTDTVLEEYADRIDPSRLGVTGGSYGGFMTNWIIGSTDRFAAAVSQRSISNWVTMWGTSDIGFFFTGDQVGGDPWDAREALWQQSPLRLAREVKTPLLLIHSRADYRCWEVEAFQFLHALRVNGATARLALFDGENHELSRSGKPKPRLRRLEEMHGWFGEYLG